MEEFSLKSCLIPKLLENKIDFKILRYKNGNPESLVVFYECNGFFKNAICRVDTKSVIGSPHCYNVVWYSKIPSFSRFNTDNTGYSRAVDLVHDIRKVIDFNFKGENNMKVIVESVDMELNTASMINGPMTSDYTIKVNVGGFDPNFSIRVKEVIEALNNEKYIYYGGRGNGKTSMNYRGGFTYNWRNEYQKERDKFDIKDVIFNDPATIVFWADGMKTVVKAENEPFDPEKGLAMAISKRALGNDYGYYDTFKKYVGRYEKKQKKGGK